MTSTRLNEHFAHKAMEYLRVTVRGEGLCEDCDLRGAINPQGGLKVKKKTKKGTRDVWINEWGSPRVDKWTGERLTSTCESCGGTGVASTVYLLSERDVKDILTDKQAFVLLRRSQGYSQKSVARAMGVSRQAVTRLERDGKRRVDQHVASGVAAL